MTFSNYFNIFIFSTDYCATSFEYFYKNVEGTHMQEWKHLDLNPNSPKDGYENINYYYGRGKYSS